MQVLVSRRAAPKENMETAFGGGFGMPLPPLLILLLLLLFILFLLLATSCLGQLGEDGGDKRRGGKGPIEGEGVMTGW